MTSELDFGGSYGIEKEDWEFIRQVIKDYNVKDVLEFGSGYSTILMAPFVDSIVSYEDSGQWMSHVLARCRKHELWNVHIKWWDRANINECRYYDLAFVDGPKGTWNREHSTKQASLCAELIIQHDAGREGEQKWAKKYLEPNFELVKTEHSCALWRRKVKK